MYPSAFEYLSPTSVEDALALLEKYGEDAKILAGGQSLLPIMKLRLAAFPYVVDISRIDGLKRIRESDDIVHIGSMVTTAAIAESDIIRKRLPVLAETALQIADLQVRNMGTVGGNLAHGDPGNDLPAMMMALGAKLVLAGRGTTRTVESSSFYVDSYQTAIEPGEILTGVDVPLPSGQWGGAYVKHKRRSGDFSLAAVACVVELDGSGAISRAGIGLTSLGPTPTRSRDAERYLVGKRLGDLSAESAGIEIAKASDLVVRSVDPPSDTYGSAEFKRTILRIIATEAIEKAYHRARGV